MMMREQRAKQFAIFDAMKGLSEALREREERHSRVQKHGISEEDQERISETLMYMEAAASLREQTAQDLSCWSTATSA